MTPLWQQIEAAQNDLLRYEIARLLNLIADEVEQRGDKQLDLDPGETADWLRAEAMAAMAAAHPLSVDSGAHL
jgi:hypothetical protein